MMKKSIWIFVFICFALAVAVAGCVDSGNNTTPDNKNNTTLDNETKNMSDLSAIIEDFGTPITPINNSSSVPENGLSYLRKQTKISDDRQSIMFVFDEAPDGDKWEMTTAPRNLLTLTTDRVIVPEEKDAEGSPNLHVWILETGDKSGQVIMNFNYIVEETGKSINNIYYVIQIGESGNINIISILYERY
ncbi:MAG: protease inhibitor I42 family protein [Methanosarcinales archaeon]|jgi:predicted secreted protein|nr:protease inhibitor I42 family protein [Methanosarcinales archaeon]